MQPKPVIGTPEERIAQLLTLNDQSDWTGPTGDYGSEFYSGDADTIGRACLAKEWDGLRDGRFAKRFVGFPQCVGNSDVCVYFFKAVANVTQTVVLNFDDFERRVAETKQDQGLWAADLWRPRFVQAVATVPLPDVGQLAREWAQTYFAEYGEEDDRWFAPDVTQAVGDFVMMCKDAAANGDDVVEVWVH